MTTQPKPRIADPDWWATRPHAIGVVNVNYTRNGVRVAHHPKPWLAFGNTVYKFAPTHAEAVAYAFKEVGK